MILYIYTSGGRGSKLHKKGTTTIIGKIKKGDMLLVSKGITDHYEGDENFTGHWTINLRTMKSGFLDECILNYEAEKLE